MLRNGPGAELQSRGLPVLRTCLIYILGAIAFCAIALAGPMRGAKPDAGGSGAKCAAGAARSEEKQRLCGEDSIPDRWDSFVF